MNEKQAKRIRRAQRVYIARESKSLAPGERADAQAHLFSVQLCMMWPSLNHRQRGAVSAAIRETDLALGVQRAIRMVVS